MPGRKQPAAQPMMEVSRLMAIKLSKRSWIVGANTLLSDKIRNHIVTGWILIHSLEFTLISTTLNHDP
jgi:hypothetical protein